MALKVKSTKIKNVILDENDKEIGIIEFDPEDANIYKKFLELIDVITEYQNIEAKIGQLENIPDYDLKTIEEFEKYKGVFNKLNQKLDNYLKMREDIENITDEIFGNVSNIFKLISGSLDPYLDLVKWATPYFKEKRENKINEYLVDESDVM